MSSMVCYQSPRARPFGGDLSSIAVVKNPLSPIEHPGGAGVNCELFELGVEQFVVSSISDQGRSLPLDANSFGKVCIASGLSTEYSNDWCGLDYDKSAQRAIYVPR